MAGTTLENGNAPADSVANGTPEKDRKSHLVNSPNGLRKGFLNSQCSAPVMAEPVGIPESELVEHVPLFSQAAAPSHVTFSTTSITLQWREVSQIGLTEPLPEGVSQQPCVMAYAIEKQQVLLNTTCSLRWQAPPAII